MIGLTHYLLLGAFLFAIGLFNALSKRNVIAVLMGVELMLNAVNMNLFCFDRLCCCGNRSCRWSGPRHQALPRKRQQRRRQDRLAEMVRGV